MPSSADTPDYIRWTGAVPELHRPTLIIAFEGWNDAGDAASMAARHVADQLETEPVAEIDPEPFYDFSTTRPLVKLDNNAVRSLAWPSNVLRVARVPGADRDVAVLIGIEPQLRWRSFCQQVIGLAHHLRSERVITLGALLADVPHSRPVEVYGASEDEHLMKELGLSPSSYEGPTGIVGVLSSATRDAGFAAGSFWAAVPSYMPGAPSPKAALALVQRICTVVGTPLYATDLEIASAAYERQVGELVAEDDDTAEYVTALEEAFDADSDENLENDPDTLVAEVEQFLRENE